MLDDRITFVEHDPQWPDLFEQAATRIRQSLGTSAVRVEHVGSTSVPGLVAKPVIDVVLEVDDSADEPTYAPALQSAGFVLRIREPKWHEHRLFKFPGAELNLHAPAARRWRECFCFVTGCAPMKPTALCTNATKRRLARERWKYVQDYADAKSAIVEAILARAASASGADLLQKDRSAD